MIKEKNNTKMKVYIKKTRSDLCCDIIREEIVTNFHEESPGFRHLSKKKPWRKSPNYI